MEGVRGWGPGLPALWGAGGEGEPLSPRAVGTEECDSPSFLSGRPRLRRLVRSAGSEGLAPLGCWRWTAIAWSVYRKSALQFNETHRIA